MTSKKPRILLAVGGGIAAYKSAMLCSALVQNHWDVRVAMTPAATQFIGPPTLAALSGHRVATAIFDPHYPLGAHIELAAETDLMVIAPATADRMAKLVHGMADDLVGALFLQIECPVLLAPAMSASMWKKPSVQRNVKQLESDGCHFVGPETGWLSCRDRGDGRMSQPDTIQQTMESLLDSSHNGLDC